MAKIEDIVKCKYAGDPEDEYCRDCDGLHPVDDNGHKQPATECGGYEPCEQVQQQPAREECADASETCGDSQVEAQPNAECTKSITSVIRAEYGVSREINGTWHKFMFSEERIVPAGCDVAAEKQALWNAVMGEIDNAIDSVR